jgi:hypothetical protein
MLLNRGGSQEIGRKTGMGKTLASVWLRSASDAMMGLVPRPLLRSFLKTFNARPELAEAAGFHVHPRRFDSPLPHMEEIDKSKLNVPRLLPAIDLRIPEALGLVKQIARWVSELDSVPCERDGKSPFWFSNRNYEDFDAATLYGMLRHLRPKRYVELGCGFSSLMSSRALKRNDEEGIKCEAIYADPCPRLPLGGVLAYGQLMEKRVQDLPLEIFSRLDSGDVLFIDTSHVLKLQSDVEHELLRIVPSLKAGVWIHIHDIYTPYDYPDDWIFRPLRLGLNEQYAVECLLSGGKTYQIEIPLYCLVRDHFDEMKAFFPRGKARAQALWMRKVA